MKLKLILEKYLSTRNIFPPEAGHKPHLALVCQLINWILSDKFGAAIAINKVSLPLPCPFYKIPIHFQYMRKDKSKLHVHFKCILTAQDVWELAAYL